MSRDTRRWSGRLVILATFAVLTLLVVVAFSSDSAVEAQVTASGEALGDERPVQRSDARPESHPTADHTQFETLDQEFATG